MQWKKKRGKYVKCGALLNQSTSKVRATKRDTAKCKDPSRREKLFYHLSHFFYPSISRERTRREATEIQTDGCENGATFTRQRADRDIFLSP